MSELHTTTPLHMDEFEVRVLSVLIEKSLTQANAYPMTINAIVLGANQKQNRDPVVEHTEGDVSRAIQRLQHKHLAKQAPPHPGERANKYKHAVLDVFGWDKREQAIMAELMLRGRQTPGELRTHASRMWNFDDLGSVLTTLESLRRRQLAMVEELAREPGRSANRWRHLLGAERSETANPPATPPSLGTLSEAPLLTEFPRLAAESNPLVERGDDGETPASLVQRIERLEARMAELERRLDSSGSGDN